MSQSRFSSRERRDAALVLGAALIYLSSAIIDPFISLALFFIFLGTVAALRVNAHFKGLPSARTP